MNKKTLNSLKKKYNFLSGIDTMDCGDGWKKLITTMCKDLNALPPPETFYITHIENKYDHLDVRTKHGNMRTRMVIDEHNTLSMDLCDGCGKDRDLESCDKCEVEVIEYPDPEEEDKEDVACGCADGSCTCTSGCSSGGSGCQGGGCGTP